MKKFCITLIAMMLIAMSVFTGCGKNESKDSELPMADNLSDKLDKINIPENEPSEETAEPIEEASEDEGLKDRRTDIQKYWNGDYYGWTSFIAKGDYAELSGMDGDVCGRIEVDENGDGTVTIWCGGADGYTYNNPTGIIEVHITEDLGDTSHGTLVSTGGWMFTDETPAGRINKGEYTVEPDEIYSPGCLNFREEYKDEYGSISALFAIKPWGDRWEDLEEKDGYTRDRSMPLFYDWYTPLIDGGWALPDDFVSQPVKTMKERELELIELAANQSTPVRTDTNIDELYVADSADSDDYDYDDSYDSDDEDDWYGDSYFNSDDDFENDYGSSRITHGYEKEIKNPKVTGKSYTWGYITMNIPEGMEAKNGSAEDGKDEYYLRATNGKNYVMAFICNEWDAVEDVIEAEDENDGDEVLITVKGTDWEGTAYDDSGASCVMVYASTDEACVEVISYGYDFDSPEVQTVLATVKQSKSMY